MKTNQELERDVDASLKWEKLLSADEIEVNAKDGTVTLTGTVNSYGKIELAEDVTKNVKGVKAINEKIEIQFTNDGNVTDIELANSIISVFRWSWQIPKEDIKIQVDDGWITLEGELHHDYQRQAARKAILNLPGVKGISNDLKIILDRNVPVGKEEIEAALARNWSINDKKILVEVILNIVTLKGKVDSLRQKEEAERIAWNASGVWAVDNELKVE